MGETLIRCEQVGKKFCRDLKKSLWYGLQDIAADLLLQNQTASSTGSLRQGEFWAARSISFEVERGQCVGLIGRNGAGKTTLLKMLSGLIKPDEGRIEIVGRVGAVIALGAGFNPLLTGRENVIVNGAVLGLSKRQIDDRLEDIVEFAEIADAIDAPVRTYSSGMQVRLGFAVAVSMLDPDILFLDEVLAVGDVGFRAKCYQRIADLKHRAACIFVSHSMNHVAVTATRGMVLENGEPVVIGDVSAAIDAYNRSAQSEANQEAGNLSLHRQVKKADFRLSSSTLGYGDPLEVTCELEVERLFRQVYLDVLFYDYAGRVVAQWNGLERRGQGTDICSATTLREKIQSVLLVGGVYRLGLVLRDSETADILAWSYQQLQVVVESSSIGACSYQMQ